MTFIFDQKSPPSTGAQSVDMIHSEGTSVAKGSGTSEESVEKDISKRERAYVLFREKHSASKPGHWILPAALQVRVQIPVVLITSYVP